MVSGECGEASHPGLPVGEVALCSRQTFELSPEEGEMLGERPRRRGHAGVIVKGRGILNPERALGIDRQVKLTCRSDRRVICEALGASAAT